MNNCKYCEGDECDRHTADGKSIFDDECEHEWIDYYLYSSYCCRCGKTEEADMLCQ